MPLRVAIFGAGSIGGYVGGHLVAAGAEVIFIGRDRFQREIKAQGLTLTHWSRQTITLAADAIRFETDPSALSEADVILVTVKSQDSAKAGQAITRYAKLDALIISLQNGLGNVAILKEAAPTPAVQGRAVLGRAILGGVVPFNVTKTGPAQLHCGTEGDLTIEDSDDARLTELHTLFKISALGCELTPDILAVQWGKLLVNLNNGLNVLHGGPLKTGLIQADYRKALASSIEEALQLVTASGVTPAKFGKASPTGMIKMLRLPNLFYKILMDRVVKIDATARSSMLDDLELGRPTEIDYLQGAVVDLAASIGRDAPVNAAIMAAVKIAFKNGDSPKMTGTEILEVAQGHL